MPLYIANTTQWQTTTATDLSPLILKPSNLQIDQDSPLPSMQTDSSVNFLQNLFELSNPHPTDQPYVLLPNTCPTMLFVLHHHTPACYLLGPLTAARKIPVPAKAVLLCAQLKPGQLGYFNRRLSSGLANQLLPLYKCFGDVDLLLSRLNHSHTFRERRQIVLEFLQQKYTAASCEDPIIRQCIDLMQKSRGICRIHAIAGTVSRSERFLSRTFRDTTGLSMKTYCEILKFQNALFRILTLQPRNLSGIVKDYGYYDLPHMNRAFKKFINYTASDIRFINAEEMYALVLPLE